MLPKNSLLTILGDAGTDKNYRKLVLCQCKCGNKKILQKSAVLNGKIKSCGCLRSKLAKEKIEQYNLTQFHSNKYWVIEKYAFIQFNNCNDIVVIDKDDLSVVQPYIWHKDDKGYARTRLNNGKFIRMHKLILSNNNKNIEIDHKENFTKFNYNIDKTLNNTKENLRLVTHQNNMMNQRKRSNNTSGYEGVTFHKATGKWQPQISLNGKRIYLGVYSTPEEAFQVRQNAKEKYFNIVEA